MDDDDDDDDDNDDDDDLDFYFLSVICFQYSLLSSITSITFSNIFYIYNFFL
jgi:hypothetical protein